MPLSNAELDFDVIVVGGGTTGVIAALAAARTGAKTCLIESSGYLGGTTYALGNVVTFHNNRMEQVVRGLPQALVDRLAKQGGVVGPGHVPNPSGQCGTVTLIDPATFNMVAFEMLREAGASILLQATVIDVSVTGGKVTAVHVYTRAGTRTLTAHTFVDTSGDADVAARAGAERESDITGQRLTGTTVFRVGNVDHEAFVDDLKRNPKRLIIHEDEYLTRSLRQTPEDVMRNVKSIYDLPFIYLTNIVRDYIPKHDWESFGISGVEKSQWGDLKPFGSRVHLSPAAASPDIVFLNTTNVHFDSTNPDEVSGAEIEGQRQVRLMHSVLKRYVPGFRTSVLLGSNPRICVRASLRVTGLYQLSKEDVETGARFEDAIARGCYPMSVTSPTQPNVRLHLYVRDGGDYDIPYRSIVPKAIDGLLVAGRCISGSREAVGSARNGAHCMAVGHAAGTAAALCAKRQTEPRRLDARELRMALKDQGAIV
jgi:hypothetical protein